LMNVSFQEREWFVGLVSSQKCSHD